MTSADSVIQISDTASFSVSNFVIPHYCCRYVDSIMIPSGLIRNRIEKIAKDIYAMYKGKTIHFLCVLKGGSKFFHDLTELLTEILKHTDCDHVPFTFDFIRVKSYQGTQSTGHVEISGVELAKLRGKELVLVEDIIDTGKTMTELIPHLQQYKPASIRVASLLEKRNGTQRPIFQADFVGFSIPNKFVIGYCLDYNDIFRDLEHICIINEEGIKQFAVKE
uniref:Hypoxanthine phosphoribosyltransferase n=1 Tax=Albugo laibachii Nc14 TaxID=890382 RepID=F0WFI3_9STRA|nr:hypoxanthineguanine phosphoribosyltransferase putati [Albugo laibachii Nc14]|eukprot:CCA19965.1 hypoxanthineguanine phosphoribosyltransferase putati [Albugo laibachii Nc14]